MTLPESAYRDLLAAQVAGDIEVPVPFGRIDVVNEWRFFEVEPAARWRDGVRQVLAYDRQIYGRIAALALYGDLDWDIITKIRHRTVGLMEIFVLRGTTFDGVDSRYPRYGRNARPAADEVILKATEHRRIWNLNHPRKPRWMHEQESRRLNQWVKAQNNQHVLFGDRDLRRYKEPPPRTGWA